MAKQGTKMTAEPSAIAGFPEEVARMDTSESEDQKEIATLAYQFWQERGCPVGSPEEDWFRAERELQSRREQSQKAA